MRSGKKSGKLKFSAFYYFVAGTLSYLWRLIFRIKIRKSLAYKKQSGAYLIVANHTSTFDMISAIGIVYPKRQNFVVAENILYSNKLFACVLTKFGAILKKQFYSDFSCVRGIKKYLDAGIPVLICPEGKVSDDGVTKPIVSSTGKLVKWLGYPVVSFVSHGGSLLRPKWGHTFRRGKMVFDCDVTLSREEIANLDADAINDKLQQSLQNNDHIYQQENNLKFRGRKIAEGLENILYKCPKCGAEFEMQSKGNELHCTVCKNTAVYGEDGIISAKDSESKVFPRIDLWENYVRESLKEEVQNDDFRFEARVAQFIDNPQTHKFYLLGEGELSIDKDKILFTQDDCEDSIEFPLSNAQTIASIPGKSITLYEKDKINRFVFTEKLMSTKFSWTVEELSKLKSGI